MNDSSPSAVLPRGAANAFVFQIFNCTSWSLILGTPMLLYLKSLGASALVLGVAVAMIPLFGALQIPAANYVERAGLKNSVVKGWASRSTFILGVFITSMLPDSVSPTLRIGLLLLMLACFASVRGISVCGYLPWITQLVPESLRGTFISRENMCMHMALTGTMLLSSWWVSFSSSNGGYGFLFLVSYLAALLSLIFLRRIPDIPEGRPKAVSVHPPWKEMFLFPPFLRYVAFNVVFNFFIAALGVVWVPYMKDGFRASSSLILVLSAYSSIVGAVSSPFVGRLLDRTGSRPVLALASVLILLSQTAWLTLAAGAWPHDPRIPFGIITLGAVGYPMAGLASTRLLMGLVPAMGRSHFFALASVSSSLTLGLMPMVWGLVLDALSRVAPDGVPPGRGWTWTPYSLVYAIVIAGTLFAQFFRRRLDEPKAMPTDEFMRLLLIQSPARLVTRTAASFRRFLPPG